MSDMSKTKPVVVGITGASGSILGFRTVKELLLLDCPVELVMTEKSQGVITEETGLKLSHQSEDRRLDILRFLGLPDEKADLLALFGNNRLDAPPSSGTHLTRGMVVVPCSMGTLGRIANGITDNLVARAADVTLKEHRKLILVPRESPFNQIHLRNMLTLSQMNVVLIPPMLTFYLRDFDSIDGQINYTIGKILDQLGFEHDLYTRWGNHVGASLPAL